MEHRLKTPLSFKDVMALRAGDVVYLKGRIFTARDKAHAVLRARGSPVSLEGAVIYHCGPLIREGYVVSAGPTTSGRLARYVEEMVGCGVRAMVGKGGLPGAAPLLKRRCVYLAYPGGCGAAAAKRLRLVGVYLEDLGMAEAVWEMEAEDFGPMVVAIDAYGRDLYQEVGESVRRRLSEEP